MICLIKHRIALKTTLNNLPKETYNLKAKKILSQLSYMESMLSEYSYQELKSVEAVNLKKSFQSFKTSLEDKVFGSSIPQRNVDINPGNEKLDGSTTQNVNILASKVSHEIRTPLNGIIGFADLLKEEGLTTKQLAHVGAIQTASFSLMKIFNELLSKCVNQTNRKDINENPLPMLNQRADTKSKNPEIDLSSMLEDCLGEIDLLENLVLLFKQNVFEFIGAASCHLKNKDLEQLAFAAHKIKAGLAMMQSDSLHSIIVTMEKCCKENADKEQLDFLYASFLREYPKTESAIDVQMNKLKKNRK
jgi:signal transduction histidine kinase